MENVRKVTYRSGIIESKEPMNALISSHDCKGTFYSNLYALNIPEMIIDNITHPDRKPKNAMAKIYNKTPNYLKFKMLGIFCFYSVPLRVFSIPKTYEFNLN